MEVFWYSYQGMTISEIKSYIEKCDGLIIEIAGPTPQGYDFLREYNIQMPDELIVTNVTKETKVWDFKNKTMVLKTIDEAADIKNLPYKDNSVALIFVSYLSITTDHGDESIKTALGEYARPLQPITNLHLFLYKEASRILKPGGLMIQAGAFDGDLTAFSQYLFTNEYQPIKCGRTLVLRKSSK